MKVSSIGFGDAQSPRSAQAAEVVERDRSNVQDKGASSEDVARKKVHTEELLDKIKGLTEDGAYSVRFELNKNLNQLVISVVNPKTEEVVRQIPPDDVVKMMEFMQDFRGQLVDSTT